MGIFGWAMVAAAVGISLIYFEGWRQGRKLRGRGETSTGSGADMMGVGMLELQKHLQPDRRVEAIQEQVKGEDRVESEQAPGRPSDDPSCP